MHQLIGERFPAAFFLRWMRFIFALFFFFFFSSFHPFQIFWAAIQKLRKEKQQQQQQKSEMQVKRWMESPLADSIVCRTAFWHRTLCVALYANTHYLKLKISWRQMALGNWSNNLKFGGIFFFFDFFREKWFKLNRDGSKERAGQM